MFLIGIFCFCALVDVLIEKYYEIDVCVTFKYCVTLLSFP